MGALLGAISMEAGRTAEAQERFETAVRLAPQETNFRFTLGMFQEAKSDASGAERSFREVIKVEPTQAEAHYRLGNLLSKAGQARAKEAETSLLKAVLLDPTHVEAESRYYHVQTAAGTKQAGHADDEF